MFVRTFFDLSLRPKRLLPICSLSWGLSKSTIILVLCQSQRVLIAVWMHTPPIFWARDQILCSTLGTQSDYVQSMYFYMNYKNLLLLARFLNEISKFLPKNWKIAYSKFHIYTDFSLKCPRLFCEKLIFCSLNPAKKNGLCRFSRKNRLWKILVVANSESRDFVRMIAFYEGNIRENHPVMILWGIRPISIHLISGVESIGLGQNIDLLQFMTSKMRSIEDNFSNREIFHWERFR